jgi:Protein of unknown function (DUF2778)
MAYVSDEYRGFVSVGGPVSPVKRPKSGHGSVLTVGAGLFAAAWVAAAAATMLSFFTPLAGRNADITRRLPSPTLLSVAKMTGPSALQTKPAITAAALAQWHARHSVVKIAQDAPLLDKAGRVTLEFAELSPSESKGDRLKPMTVSASVSPAKTGLVAMAAVSTGTLQLAVAKPKTPKTVEVASADADPDSVDAFNLVMKPSTAEPGDPGYTVPLPMARPARTKPAVPAAVAALAYAPTQDDSIDLSPRMKSKVTPPPRGGKTAVFDLSAGIVYMPNGEKMEAHSGVGKMRDNPKYVHVRMLGPTPPSTYRLSMRESLFHGVAAIRMTPTNGINPHGRDGILAHSYMLRTRGDSHGCVVFADYNRFLSAFKRGAVTHIVVVPKWTGSSSDLAKL